jgi:hypothetical protein
MLSPGQDWKPVGELEDLDAVEDELESFLPEGAEDDWRDLDQDPGEQKTDAEWLEIAGWGKDGGKEKG